MYGQFILLFALMLTGFTCKKTKLISNDMNRDLNNFLIYIATPCLVVFSVYSIEYDESLVGDFFLMFAIALGVYVFYLLAAFLFVKLLKLKGPDKDVVQMGTIFKNTGFMGFPVALLFFGVKGLFFMTIMNTMHNIFLWTYGVTLLQRSDTDYRVQKKWKASNLLKLAHPCIIAVFVGLGLVIFHIQLPGAVYSFFDMVGGVAVPMSMVYVGSMLADQPFLKVLSNKLALKASLANLILMPAIVYAALYYSGLPELMIQIAVLGTAVPIGVGVPILAGKYESSVYLASEIVFLSTLISVVTIPVTVFLLGFGLG